MYSLLNHVYIQQLAALPASSKPNNKLAGLKLQDSGTYEQLRALATERIQQLTGKPVQTTKVA